MLNKRIRPIIVWCLLGIFWVPNLFAQTDTLTQYSTIDALLSGIYDGEMSVGELKRYGNFGLGTFNALDGEMLVVDSRVYQITSTGAVFERDDRTKTPFAAVTFFEADTTLNIPSGVDFPSLEKLIDQNLPSQNLFYAIRIDGTFTAVKTRAVPRQHLPYRPLKEIAATQPTFSFHDVAGTIVGFRCPSYVRGLNVPGYHLHFLTRDRTSGGHVLEVTIEKATAQIDVTTQFSMILPTDGNFSRADLTRDTAQDLKKVER